MKPEAQRIAIAEACGWSFCHCDNPMGEPKTGPIGSPPLRTGGEVWNDLRPLPDYLNDLNAMHEAEKVLTDAQWLAYSKHLEHVVPYARHRGNVHATAAQRCEAFLRTLSLWKDEP